MIYACNGNKELFQSCDISYFRLITNGLLDSFFKKEHHLIQKATCSFLMNEDTDVNNKNTWTTLSIKVSVSLFSNLLEFSTFIC